MRIDPEDTTTGRRRKRGEFRRCRFFLAFDFFRRTP
jgi:hypothetical protein